MGSGQWEMNLIPKLQFRNEKDNYPLPTTHYPLFLS
jgi:hypothetical protein